MSRAGAFPLSLTNQPMRHFRAIFELDTAVSANSNLVQNADIPANVSARSSDGSHIPQVQAGATDPLIQEMRSRKHRRERRSHPIPLWRAWGGLVPWAVP